MINNTLATQNTVFEKSKSLDIPRIFWFPEDKDLDLSGFTLIRKLNTIGGIIVKISSNAKLISIPINGIELTNIRIELSASIENSPTLPLSATSNALNVNPIWNKGYNGSDIIVAIIDTGIDFNHPSLVGKNYLEKSFKKVEYGYNTDEGPEDYHGHGTSVASLVVANDPDNPDKRGMAFGSKVVNAKVGVEDGFITAASLIAAIDWVSSIDEVDVISISMGEPESGVLEDLLEKGVNTAVKNGKIVVLSAGNNGNGGVSTYEPHSIGSPGSSIEGITVGAVDFINHLASFSSEGPTYGWEAKPDVVAPGVSIPVAIRGGSYGYSTGTSFSTPLISGVVALLISSLKHQNITYTPGAIKIALSRSATDLGLEWMKQGHGLVNASKALEILEESTNLALIYPTTIPNPLRLELPAGNSLSSPVTLISSNIGKWTTKSISGNGTSFIHYNLDTLVEGFSQVLLIAISPEKSATPAIYTTSVTLLSPLNIELTFQIEIKILPPLKYKMLVDLVHTPWSVILNTATKLRVERLYGMDIGAFSELTKLHGIWTDEFLTGYLNKEILNNYDLLWLPSAFSLTYPDYYDHELERSVRLSSDELFAIYNFVKNGGRLLIDYGGVSSADSYFDRVIPDVSSLISLFSILGIEIVNITVEKSTMNSFTQNTTTIGNNSYNIIAGFSNLNFGIPIASNLNGINTVAFIGSKGRAFISNTRNWRDNVRMSDKTPQGGYEFAEEVIKWIIEKEGVQSIEFEKHTDGTFVIGKIVDATSIKKSELKMTAKRNGFYIDLLNLDVDETGKFSVLLPDIFTGNISLSIQYSNDYIQIDKRLDFFTPEINLIEKPEHIAPKDEILKWTFEILDNREIPMYNIQVLVNGKTDVSGLSYSINSNSLVVTLNQSEFSQTGIKIIIQVQVIDRDGNLAIFNTDDYISTTTQMDTNSSNSTIKTKSSKILLYSTSFLILTVIFIRYRNIRKKY